MREDEPNWSDWISLDPDTITSKVPDCCGVCRTRVVGGNGQVIYIGRTEGNLQLYVKGRADSVKQVLANNQRHEFQLSQVEKDLISNGERLEISYICVQSKNNVQKRYAQIFHDHISDHGARPLAMLGRRIWRVNATGPWTIKAINFAPPRVLYKMGLTN